MAFSAWGQTTSKPVTAANTLVVSSVKTTGIMITGCDFAFQCHTDISTVLSILPPPSKKNQGNTLLYTKLIFSRVELAELFCPCLVS